MSIEFKPEHRYVAFWFAECETFNLMGWMWLNEANELRSKYRLRYFKDDKFFDSDDERSWYEVDHKRGPDDTKEVITLLQSMFLIGPKHCGFKWDRFDFDELPQTPGDQMIDYLATKDWAHTRVEQP